MKITHVQETTNDIVTEYLKVEYTDIRYPNAPDVMHLSHKEATLLQAELSKELASIPY